MIAERNDRLTWDRLCAMCPALRKIAANARERRLRRGPRDNPWADYEDMKRAMGTYVGWDRPTFHEILSTSEAYEVVLKHVTQILDI